jgi:cytochrome c biogenesis protein CcdA
MTVDTISSTMRPAPKRTSRALLAVFAGGAIILTLLASGLVLIPRYRAAHPITDLQRSDADRVAVDDLYLDLTLVTPKFLASRDLGQYLGERDHSTVLPLLVGVNTHTGTIEHMHHLDGDLFLVGQDGARYPAMTEPIVLTDHHNAYMLLFPPRDNYGMSFLDQQQGNLVIEAVGMGNVELRRFEWTLPLDETAGQGLVATLMLAVALTSALIVVLSPCALELTLYYTAIISATISEDEQKAVAHGGLGAAAAEGRRRVLINLASFVAGFTLLYATAGATVGLIGQGVRQPLGEYSQVIQWVGGCLILYFALRVLGLDQRISAVVGRIGKHLPNLGIGSVFTFLRGKIRWHLTRLRFRGENRAAEHGTMRPRDSFLVGMGLSSSCLGCMGGAVLYPLLVYAGITSWYSGMITLGLYSLGIALPMVLIAIGFFRLRLSFGKRLGVNRALKVFSGTMLAGIGLLILTGQERIMTDVAFRLLADIPRWVG